MATVLRWLALEAYKQQCVVERERIGREVISQPVVGAGATAPGDARRMRGVPIIGPGVRGASPGSVPGENLGLLDDNDLSDLTPPVSNPLRSHVRWDTDAWTAYYAEEQTTLRR
jgi:hypothetical protein